jgi:hypothetical protein
VLHLLPPLGREETSVGGRKFGWVVLIGRRHVGRDVLALLYSWIMRNSFTMRGQWTYPPAKNIRLITLTAPGFWMNHFDP